LSASSVTTACGSGSVGIVWVRIPLELALGRARFIVSDRVVEMRFAHMLSNRSAACPARPLWQIAQDHRLILRIGAPRDARFVYATGTVTLSPRRLVWVADTVQGVDGGSRLLGFLVEENLSTSCAPRSLPIGSSSGALTRRAVGRRVFTIVRAIWAERPLLA